MQEAVCCFFQPLSNSRSVGPMGRKLRALSCPSPWHLGRAAGLARPPGQETRDVGETPSSWMLPSHPHQPRLSNTSSLPGLPAPDRAGSEDTAALGQSHPRWYPTAQPAHPPLSRSAGPSHPAPPAPQPTPPAPGVRWWCLPNSSPFWAILSASRASPRPRRSRTRVSSQARRLSRSTHFSKRPQSTTLHLAAPTPSSFSLSWHRGQRVGTAPPRHGLQKE